jgi:putative ABC transport system permease protein
MPDWRPEIRARLTGVRLSPAREAEIIEELSQHLEDRWREQVAAGADPEIARQQALGDFRGTEVLGRYLAPLRQSRWADPTPPAASRPFSWDGLMSDLRTAVRALRAAPGFTVIALIVLTLGIGATTAIFSVVDAVVLRPLPFDEPDRLVAVGERSTPTKGGPVPAGAGKPVPAGAGKARMPWSPDAGDPQALALVQPQNYLDWTVQQQVFESLAATADGEFTLQMPGAAPEDVVALRVTASFFDVLRIRPAIGRVFTADSEVEGQHRVAIVSDAFWRQRLGASPDVVGRTITLEGATYEVLGVMPREVTYPVGALRPTDLWVPYVVPPNERVRGRGISMYLKSIARLKPGGTLEQAQAHMDQIAAAIAQANPESRGTRAFGVRPLRDHLVGASMRSWMLMLLASVGIVLLIACANVANLLLARATSREREIAVRAALGAGRGRLVRQFIVESLVLSAAGAILGVILAYGLVQALRGAMPEGVPRVTTIALDLRVLAATAGVSLITGLLFGLVPAWQMSKPNLNNALNDGTRGASAGRARQRLRGALVVVEVALAVVLLVGAALFIGSFVRLMRVDLGFNPNGVITMQLYSPAQPGQRPPDWSATFSQIVDRLGQSNGIVQASAVSPGIPLSVRLHMDGLTVRGGTIEGQTGVSLKRVTPGYHQALRIPLRSGRLFESTDRDGSPNVAIISDTAAKTFFPGEDPLGRTVVVARADRTVVGVVADVRQWSLEESTQAEVYLAMAQVSPGTGYLVIRTGDDPRAALPAIRAAVLDVLPDVPLRYVATMDELVARQTAQRRLNMLMLGLFGLLGLVISAVGVYGVMAYAVSQRTREIGVRMALGATRSQVMGMIFANASLLIVAGLVCGGAGAWYLSASAKAFLYELEPNDVRAFVAASLTLSLAAIAASAIPARRAASVDPTVALRAE